jgi:hypothetical protein
VRLRSWGFICKMAIFSATAAFISGCGVRPTTQQVTGLETSRIAQAIRCEMRDAYIQLLIGAITLDGFNKEAAATMSRDRLFRYVPASNGVNLSDDEIRVLRAKHESEIFKEFLTSGYRNMVDPDRQIKQVVETYSKVFIAYKFIFDMTQTNGLGGNVDILSVFSRGTLSSPIGGSFEGKRRAKREFVQADRVDTLLTNRPTIRECNRFREELSGERQPNGAYPIAGKLNIIEIVRNFITSNQSGNLIGQLSDSDLFTSADKPPLPSLSETLVFTTTLKGGINPKLELKPQSSGTDIRSAVLSANTERIDIHTLTLVMQLPGLRTLTVAEARNADEMRVDQAELDDQALEMARELRRLADRNNESVIERITGQ